MICGQPAHLHKKQSREVAVRKPRPSAAKVGEPPVEAVAEMAPNNALARAEKSRADVAAPARTRNLLPMKILDDSRALAAPNGQLGIPPAKSRWTPGCA